ncbi:hypothetical protein IKL64_07300 [bacterium]|nr:hypothetical protein [bacterium]
MALYDSSQLLNIINSANVYFSKLYPIGVGNGNSTNPYGFNDLSAINFNANAKMFGNLDGLEERFPELFKTSASSSSSSSGLTRSSSMAYLNSAQISAGDSSTWSRYGYDASAGARLAGVARNNSVGFTGYCARYVKDAICDAGLGNYEYGHAYQMDDILRRNSNFREIPATTDVRSLPAGCVLVFNQGSKGYSSKYGHTEITDGNGHGISDGVTNNLRQPDAIFMPVAA